MIITVGVRAAVGHHPAWMIVPHLWESRAVMHLFPGYLPQRRMTFPGAGMQVEVRMSFLPLTGPEIPGGCGACGVQAGL